MVLPLALLASACVPERPRQPAELARFEVPARDGCEIARPADFEGVAESQLQGYVDWLARTRGADVALAPGDVTLAIAQALVPPCR